MEFNLYTTVELKSRKGDCLIDLFDSKLIFSTIHNKFSQSISL